MMEHSAPEQQAKMMLKKIIMNEEKKAAELKHELESFTEDCEQLKLYMTSLELFASGYSYWCSTCPRYHRIQKEEDFVARM